MHYYDGNFAGMHLIWWIIWLLFIAWVFLYQWTFHSKKQKMKAHWISLKSAMLKVKFHRKNLKTREGC